MRLRIQVTDQTVTIFEFDAPGLPGGTVRAYFRLWRTDCKLRRLGSRRERRSGAVVLNAAGLGDVPVEYPIQDDLPRQLSLLHLVVVRADRTTLWAQVELPSDDNVHTVSTGLYKPWLQCPTSPLAPRKQRPHRQQAGQM